MPDLFLLKGHTADAVGQTLAPVQLETKIFQAHAHAPDLGSRIPDTEPCVAVDRWQGLLPCTV